MIITVSKSEFKSLKDTLEEIGLETVKTQVDLSIITEEESLYYIEDLKLSSKLSAEKLQEINDTYGAILMLKATEDTYEIWINPAFITDYVELYKGLTIGLIGIFADVYKKTRFLLEPMVKSFISKWKF